MKCRNCRHLYKDWCEHKLDIPDPDLDRECKDYMQATYADRIRSMSNEELSKFLCEFRSCDSVCTARSAAGKYGYPCSGCKAESYCRPGHTGMEDWLQQPAEEEDT